MFVQPSPATPSVTVIPDVRMNRGQHVPVFRRVGPSPEIQQSPTEEQFEFDVPRSDGRSPAIFRFEARAFAPLFNTQVRIECVRLFQAPFQWSSSFDEEPQGVFKYGEADDSSLLVTSWLGGTRNWTRIYTVKADGVALLLETSTREGLKIEPTSSGYPTITATLATPGTQGPGEELPLIRYEWDQARRTYTATKLTR